MSFGTKRIYDALADESKPYAVWVLENSGRFSNPGWLADETLTSIPARARTILESKTGDAAELKVYIGPPTPHYGAFYRAGAVELPLRNDGIVVADVRGFTDRLRSSEHRYGTVSPVDVPNAVIPNTTYQLSTPDATVPTISISALSSGFADAVTRSEWRIDEKGSFVSMSLYLDITYRRTTLIGKRIDACVALERTIAGAKATAADLFNGPRPSATNSHSGEELGFLCARYRKSTEELVLHLSESEFEALNVKFPILRDALSGCTRTVVLETRTAGCIAPQFYDIPFKTLSWTRDPAWIGRVLLSTFISTRECSGDSKHPLPTFLLLKAVYIDLEL